jgi:hypothetical protein
VLLIAGFPAGGGVGRGSGLGAGLDSGLMTCLFSLIVSLQRKAKIMNKDTLYLEIPLEDVRQDLNQQIGGIDTIKTTMRSVLSAASLIVSLVGALQLLTVKIAPAWMWLYQVGIVLAAFLYLALIVMCILALWPVHVWSPIAADWDELTTAYKGLDEKEALLKRLSAVLNAIDQNTPLVRRYARLQMAALVLLPAIVLVLLLLALIPRV